MTYDKEQALIHVRALLDMGALTECPNTGTLNLDPNLYEGVGKTFKTLDKTYGMGRAKILAPLYAALWPKKVMSGGRPVRQGPVALTRKLTIYINKYNATDEQILDATKRYLATKAKENYAYMSCSDYFIEKNGNSLLESYISNPELGAKDQERTVVINQRFV